MQGYNATVLAYGQTGSGKTLTMSGGTGTYGIPEKGEQQLGWGFGHQISTAAVNMAPHLVVAASAAAVSCQTRRPTSVPPLHKASARLPQQTLAGVLTTQQHHPVRC